MLKFDRYGFNDDYGVYSSRYFAERAAECLVTPVIIKSEMIEGEKVFALWSRCSLDFKVGGQEMS